MDLMHAVGLGIVAVAVLVMIIIAMAYRRVVPANEVHVVQRRKSTVSYGTGADGHDGTKHSNGNTYYAWPSWVPYLGVTVTQLATSVFDLQLEGYEAYDKGRLPFVVDVMAFFRVTDSAVAARRVATFQELNHQLKAIVQGAVRTILASNDIEEIMQGRSKFGQQFTDEVAHQLLNWGVSAVKNIELMDIRDHKGSGVIEQIMAKKKSHIEAESRQTVAANQRAAQMAEIAAKQEVALRDQEAKQSVGFRTIEAQQMLDLREQERLQTVKEQEAATATKNMAVEQIKRVREAEIARDVQVVQAQQSLTTAKIEKDRQVVQAEQNRDTSVLVADGFLESERRKAQAVKLTGEARADAEKALAMAPIQAQIALAHEIGQNNGYQNYLVNMRQVEASQMVGIEQAKALTQAEIKVIANTGGSPSTGLQSISELFSSKGGVALAAMAEGLTQTDTGKALINKLTK
jgi:flotillin